MSESISLEHLGRVKQKISLEIEGPSTIHLPDSLVLKFDRKKEQTDDEAIQEQSKQFAGVDDKVINTSSEPDNKLNLFVDISYALNADDKHNVKKEILIRV